MRWIPGGLQPKLLLGQLALGCVQLRFADSPKVEFHNLSAPLIKTASFIVRFFLLLSGISFMASCLAIMALKEPTHLLQDRPHYSLNTPVPFKVL